MSAVFRRSAREICRRSTLFRASTRLPLHSPPKCIHSTAFRELSTTPVRRYAKIQPTPPGKISRLLASPSPEYIEKEEISVDLVPPEQARLEITDRAAEHLQRVANQQTEPLAGLRILVESGGCHGYQYKMTMSTAPQPDDYHFEHPDVKPSNIYVDAVSLALLNGSTIDYATELIGSAFRVAANPHATDGGCGCGVSWELKV
ncbi:uncharacterized protein SCHCODRAFT_02631683 [Schizophyllum commune H4-8]|nr:uncharacterized protein SCHCODRAFT_02631683 [Schizophyllum commune H4-8]KAI5890376.1 hypothetical protein SCHCODRAFT_02631683 [Schizophyllum commune H4-8]